MLLGKETLRDRIAQDKAERPTVGARQQQLLESRYDLTAKPDPKVRMSRGKPVQVGPATKLPQNMTWEQLAAMAPEDIRAKGLFPKGFLPLPHPKHNVGGMVFPQTEIKQLPRLERFDVDFDLPDYFLPEFPPALYLTTRPDLGDVSQGKMITVDNFQEMFAGILNAKDLEGMRSWSRSFRSNSLTPRPTAKRRARWACRAWGASTAMSTATHLERPTWLVTSGRNRIAADSIPQACGA